MEALTTPLPTGIRHLQVGSWLRIEASITERTGRKVWLRATLTDPAAVERGIVHCEARGLFLLKSQ
jgi:hypothetical protein